MQDQLQHLPMADAQLSLQQPDIVSVQACMLGWFSGGPPTQAQHQDQSRPASCLWAGSLHLPHAMHAP